MKGDLIVLLFIGTWWLGLWFQGTTELEVFCGELGSLYGCESSDNTEHIGSEG